MRPSPPAARLLHGRGRLLDGATLRSPWALLVGSDGRIAWAGTDPQDAPDHVAERTDLGAALVTPGLVDAHTHPVFAGDRADETAARLEGAPYSGGGILRTMAATRAASNEELEALVEARLRAAVTAGTTTVECKSGYGLSLDEELRALRIVGRVAERLPVRIVCTFLGAHAVPPDASSPDAYVAEVCEAMIPAVAAEGLADFVDAFCDEGFFSVAHLGLIGAAARASGLGLRVHAEQLARTGATEAAIGAGATSVDHLEQLDATGVAALAASSTVATLLPAPAIVLRDALPPARALIDAGATVALASDANAGTFGAFGAMPLIVGLGATLLGMTAREALSAATVGGAASLGRRDEIGTLAPGAFADLVAWDADHEGAFALRLGAVRPLHVLIGGVEVAVGA